MYEAKTTRDNIAVAGRGLLSAVRHDQHQGRSATMLAADLEANIH